MANGQSYTIETVPNPQLSHSFVSNPDGILQESTVQTLNVKIDSLWRENGTEIAVVALNSIGEYDIDMFATKLYDKWKIGQEKQDNGLLVLLVMDIHRIVIRTGYGVEGVLTDVTSARIIRNIIIPEFKKDDYDSGIIKGLEAIINVVKEEHFEIEEEQPVNWKETLPYAVAVYILIMLLAFLWMKSNVKNILQNQKFTTNIARYKEIKDQNIGTYSMVAVIIPFVGLVLILFLLRVPYILLLFPMPIVGLPSYVYGRYKMNQARRQPIPCNECGKMMHLLSEDKEDAHLKISQQFEEQLNAVDYDVFLCDNCHNETIFSLEKLNEYTRCPKCNTKAYGLVSKRIVVAPTYINSGTLRTTYRCKFCDFENHQNTQLPRLRRNSSGYGGAVGGGFSSGRGGFGGGGFGGGMTGGGGASGGW